MCTWQSDRVIHMSITYPYLYVLAITSHGCGIRWQSHHMDAGYASTLQVSRIHRSMCTWQSYSVIHMSIIHPYIHVLATTSHGYATHKYIKSITYPYIYVYLAVLPCNTYVYDISPYIYVLTIISHGVIHMSICVITSGV